MRALYATLLLLSVACAARHEEVEIDDSVGRPERTAADPSFEPGQTPPVTTPPRTPSGTPSLSDARVFAQATPGIYEMALDATHLYWVTDGIFGPSEVWRANRETAVLEKLAVSTKRVYALAIDETHVYYVETPDPSYVPPGFVVRVPKSGGATEIVVATADNPTSIAVDSSHVYFSRAYSPDGAVQRAPKAGGPIETVVSDVDNPWDFAVDETHLYVSEMNRGRIIRVPKASGTVEVLASGWLATGWMAIGGGDVYFQTCDGGSCEPATLRTASTSGGPVSALHQSTLNQPGKTAYGQSYVLWSTWFVPLDGTPPTNPFTAVAPDIVATGVAGDDHAVFVADHPSGQIFTASVSIQ